MFKNRKSQSTEEKASSQYELFSCTSSDGDKWVKTFLKITNHPFFYNVRGQNHVHKRETETSFAGGIIMYEKFAW